MELIGEIMVNNLIYVEWRRHLDGSVSILIATQREMDQSKIAKCTNLVQALY